MFKNLKEYKLQLSNPIDIEQLDGNIYNLMFIQRNNAKSCLGYVPLKDGWDTLYHTQDGNLFLRVKLHEKKISKDKLNDAISNRIQDIKNHGISLYLGREAEELTKEDKESIAWEVEQSLYPTADYKNNYVTVVIVDYINNVSPTMLIDNTSNKLVESSLELVQKALNDDGLVLQQQYVNDVVEKLTEIVSSKRKLVEPFELGNKTVLLNTETKEKATIDKQDPLSDEVQEHISSGKTVQQLGLTYDGILSFVLDKDSNYKGIKFDMEFEGEDEEEVFNSFLFYSVKELTNMLNIIKNI